MKLKKMIAAGSLAVAVLGAGMLPAPIPAEASTVDVRPDIVPAISCSNAEDKLDDLRDEIDWILSNGGTLPDVIDLILESLRIQKFLDEYCQFPKGLQP